MEVLVYRIDGLVTLTISTRGKVESLRDDYERRFGEEARTDYKVSNPGDLAILGREEQGIVDKLSDSAVVFETPNYFFDITFDRDSGVKPGSMSVRHHLEEVVGRFYTRELNVSGQLSFVNEPGKFRLEVTYMQDGNGRSFWIEFMVLSSKMNVERDYREILTKVEHEDRGMIFSAYAKTVNDVAVKDKADRAGDWSWAVYFERAFDEYEEALKRILHEPHKRIVSRMDYRRADQIRKWSVPMAREYARIECDRQRLAGHRFQNATAENTFDTPENRFVKHTLGVMGEWLSEAARNIKQNDRYAEEFKKSLSDRAVRFAEHFHAPLLKSVGRYAAVRGGSLVLQMRPGYAQIRIVWELMHSLFTSDSRFEASRRLSVGFNSLAALYEFWCFLSMRDIVDSLLGTEGEWRRESVMPEGLSVARILEDAIASEDSRNVKAMGYRYLHGEQCVAELMFQQSYGPDSQQDEHGFGYARPFYQRPDIVLRVFQGERSYTYLFDAKYQLDSGYDNLDAAPRAALDQMHRYRDAILYRHGHVTRDVVGAYILYPGDDNRELFDYSEILEEQNIGAFPLLPGNVEKLKSYLQGLFAMAMGDEDYTSWMSEEAIPQRWLEYVRESDHVVTDRAIIVAKGYPKDYAKVVAETKLCPWILPRHMSPTQPRLVLCGSVHGVVQVRLDHSEAPIGPLTKQQLFETYNAFAALEPGPNSKARAFPKGQYFVWKVDEVIGGE